MSKANNWAEWVAQHNQSTLDALMPKEKPEILKKSAIEPMMLEAVALAINKLLPPLLEDVINEVRVMRDEIDEIWEYLREDVSETE